MEEENQNQISQNNIIPKIFPNSVSYKNQQGRAQIASNIIKGLRQFHTQYRFSNYVAINERNFSTGFYPKLKQQMHSRLFENLIPNKCENMMSTDASIYNCILNYNGSMMLITTQSGLKIYDLSDNCDKITPHAPIYTTGISWTLTDSDLSDDDSILVHSSLNPMIGIFDVTKNQYLSWVNLDNPSENDNDYDNYYLNESYWNSTRVILTVGTGAKSQGAYVSQFDLQQKKMIMNFPAHTEDINSICYINKQQSPVFLSSSDDGSIHMYDPRALGIKNLPVSNFLGHFSGITCVTSKDDGVYFASNSKDQSLKIWDARKPTLDLNQKNQFFLEFDYRYQKLADVKRLREQLQKQNKDSFTDVSVQTFTSHKVYQTLIRCRFSPKFLTNSRFIYTGSADGGIYIYDLFENDLVAVLKSTQRSLIRDCNWHPFQPIILETNFMGRIAKWQYSTTISAK